MQDDLLLTGTLADNIAFFDPRLDLERVEAAARLARIHEEVVRMPMGYQSLVGDMGAALSAGQRQRILLARALYRYPDVLFLDEGTANLDEENENAIADLIAALPVTRVVVAHRPALIERAQIVLKLENGRIEAVRSAAPTEPQRQVAYAERRIAERRSRYG
jgi:ATP-binding cassette subfamily B protein RaxB